MAASHRLVAGVVAVAFISLGAGTSLAQLRKVDATASTPITVVTATDLAGLPTCGRILDTLKVPPTPALNTFPGVIAVAPPTPGPGTPTPAMKPVLDDITFRFGNGALRQAADPFCVDSREELEQPMTFFFHGDPVGRLQLTARISTPPHPFTPPAGAASSYFMSPMILPGEVQTIRGPFSGPSVVDVNGVPGVVLAQTPRTLYWMLPADAPTGAVRITVRNGGNGAAFSEYVLGLAMSADDLHLIKGQSTTLHATVFGPDGMPASAWTAGDVSEVIDLGKVKQLFPGYRIPSPGDPGVLFFRLDNVTRDTVSLKPSKNESFIVRLTRQSFAKGPYTYTGRIQSKKGGDFSINGIVVAFFAPVAGVPLGPTDGGGGR